MMKSFAAAVAVLCATTSVQASTVTISAFSVGAYNAAVGSLSNVVTEDFESFGEGTFANGTGSAVGTFSTLGGVGSGGTVSNSDFANDGTTLAIRDGNVYGRTSTTKLLSGNASDDKFLDSNDTFGIEWVVSLGSGAFDKIFLTLSDAADTGARMVVSTANGGTQTLNAAGNGNKQLVSIEFGEAVQTATIRFENLSRTSDSNRRNDGFSIDDIAISAVPVPGTLGLLLAGLGGLGLVARRRHKRWRLSATTNNCAHFKHRHLCVAKHIRHCCFDSGNNAVQTAYETPKFPANHCGIVLLDNRLCLVGQIR